MTDVEIVVTKNNALNPVILEENIQKKNIATEVIYKQFQVTEAEQEINDKETEEESKKEEPSEKEEEQKDLSCFEKFQKAIGMESGSFNSGVFSQCILLIGTGCLALPKTAEYISLVFTPVAIVIAGLANMRAFVILAELSDKYKIETYSGLVRHLYGKGMGIFLDIALIFDTFLTMLVYQVCVYKLLGGVINDLGNLGYKSVDDFLQNSFWKNTWCKFSVNYGIAALILLPGCLLKNVSKMRFVSVFGIISLFILMLILLIQSPWFASNYFKNIYNKDDPNTQLNVYDITSGFTKDLNFFKSISTIFFSYCCHVGVFPIINSLKNKDITQAKKVFKVGTIISMVCYIVIGVSGYLTQPINTPALIFERETIFNNDIIMTIGRIFFILALFTKIPALYNGVRFIFLEFFGYEKDNYSNKANILITVISLVIISFIGSIYQNVTNYISLVGSFSTTIIAFTIPGLSYIKGSGLGYSFKNIANGILFGLLTAIGFIGGILTIISMAKGE